MKYVGYTLVGIVAVLTVAVLALLFSANSSLDDSFRHTQATQQLPLLNEVSAAGLVRISTDRGEFRARVAGLENDQGPLVVLLHGFPVTSAMWIDLITPLAQAGYRVVAFDQRGYSPAVRPIDVADYVVPELVADVFAVVAAFGDERFHLVGHDWGAAVGWSVVLTAPERISSWTAMSIAHPAAFQAALENDPDQQSKSAYFKVFQTPRVPETLFSLGDFQVLKGLYAGMPEANVAEYIAVLGEPGALTAALNWYRAMAELMPTSAEPQNMQVSVPTLFIWGNQDDAVGRRGVENMADYMSGPYSVIELDAGHWLIAEKQQQAIEPILEHIQRYRGESNSAGVTLTN